MEQGVETCSRALVEAIHRSAAAGSRELDLIASRYGDDFLAKVVSAVPEEDLPSFLGQDPEGIAGMVIEPSAFIAGLIFLVSSMSVSRCYTVRKGVFSDGMRFAEEQDDLEVYLTSAFRPDVSEQRLRELTLAFADYDFAPEVLVFLALGSSGGLSVFRGGVRRVYDSSSWEYVAYCCKSFAPEVFEEAADIAADLLESAGCHPTETCVAEEVANAFQVEFIRDAAGGSAMLGEVLREVVFCKPEEGCKPSLFSSVCPRIMPAYCESATDVSDVRSLSTLENQNPFLAVAKTLADAPDRDSIIMEYADMTVEVARLYCGARYVSDVFNAKKAAAGILSLGLTYEVGFPATLDAYIGAFRSFGLKGLSQKAFSVFCNIAHLPCKYDSVFKLMPILKEPEGGGEIAKRIKDEVSNFVLNVVNLGFPIAFDSMKAMFDERLHCRNLFAAAAWLITNTKSGRELAECKSDYGIENSPSEILCKIIPKEAGFADMIRPLFFDAIVDASDAVVHRFAESGTRFYIREQHVAKASKLFMKWFMKIGTQMPTHLLKEIGSGWFEANRHQNAGVLEPYFSNTGAGAKNEGLF